MATASVNFSPAQTPEAYVDPYPLYARMREVDPVHWSETDGVWYITSHKHVYDVLIHPDWASSAKRASAALKAAQEAAKGGDRSANIAKYGRLAEAKEGNEARGLGTEFSILIKDPPEHTRLRTLVTKAFSARTIQRMEDSIQRLVDSQLERVDGLSEIDYMEEYARPLPTMVLGDLLGVAESHWPTLVEFSEISEVMFDPNASDEHVQRYRELEQVFNEIILEVVEQKQREPGDDFVSEMIAAREGSDRLTGVELVSMVWTIISAGTKTTVDLLGNGMRALVERPVELDRIRREPGLWRTAPDEFLRYDAPAHMLNRVAAIDFELGGKRIEAGDPIANVVSAANRDPAQFDRPDEIVLERSPNRQLSLGHGLHFCLGGPLAKLEAQIAIRSIVERFPNLALAGEPVRRHSLRHSGLERLPLAL